MNGAGRGENADYQYQISDDIYFCRRAVSEAGAKILVDTNCYCRHIDWKTGKEYQLRDDALPVIRAGDAFVKRNSQWMTPNEQGALREIAAGVAGKSGDETVIVEVGSFVGQSTNILADRVPDGGKVYCVDTWQGTPGDATETLAKAIGGKDSLLGMFKRQLKKHINRDVVVPVIGESIPAATRLAEMGVKADLVFIDADHERCGEDIAAWLPLLKPDGVICGHDYAASFPSVMRDVRAAFGDKIKVVDSIWIRSA